MTAQKQVTPDQPIQGLIARCWGPCGFSDRPVSDDDLRSLFEAARWAASSFNEQPWRYILATARAGCGKRRPNPSSAANGERRPTS